jgi:hypothetical protein
VTVWDRERVERDSTYVASSTGSKFFGTEPRETNRMCLYVHLTSQFDTSSPSLFLSSLVYNHFELASKVISIDYATRGKKNYLFHSSFIITRCNANLGWSSCSKSIIFRFCLFTPTRRLLALGGRYRHDCTSPCKVPGALPLPPRGQSTLVMRDLNTGAPTVTCIMDSTQ